MHPDRLLTTSLRAAPQGRALAEVMAAALEAADPAAAVRAHLRRDGAAIEVGDRRYEQAGRVLLVGGGKAAAPMAQAALAILGERVSAGVLVTKDGHTGGMQAGGATLPAGADQFGLQPSAFSLLEAGHPVPDARGAAAAQRIVDLLAGLQPDDLVLVLISGGGSALLTQPAPGLSLADLQAMTRALLRCGAPIEQINTLRKHTTRLFGGQLARLAAPAHVAALVISDVIGSPLDVIASGPTTPDPTSFADAWAVVERYGLAGDLPPALVAHLRHGMAGALADTPKPGEGLWARVHNTVIASNVIAAEAAVAAAQTRGFNAMLLTTYLEGEAREVGRVAAGLARELVLRNAPLARPALLVAGGETTVTLRGDGLGGRNQELALGAAEQLAGLPGALVVALASDGGDGPTDAAGAVVSGDTLARARAQGHSPAAFLARNDAYHFFAPLGDLLRPGPTQTNVNDLLFIAALG
ncbi:MAG: glycerate kinase [Kouleothrix sp.]|jgi:hydroxypyruvate reductase|nr:glycerate kinase [Kouleothrix sp.]